MKKIYSNEVEQKIDCSQIEQYEVEAEDEDDARRKFMENEGVRLVNVSPVNVGDMKEFYINQIEIKKE